jgi:hypothetical protein
MRGIDPLHRAGCGNIYHIVRTSDASFAVTVRYVAEYYIFNVDITRIFTFLHVLTYFLTFLHQEMYIPKK